MSIFVNKTWRDEIIIILLLCLTASIVCYLSVLNAGFIWDDEFLVVRNPLLRAPILSFQIFKQDIINSGFTYTTYYRPIQILSYVVDYRMWGMSPFAFHLTNVLLHFLNGVLVFFLTCRITGKRSAGLLTSLLFLIHPAQTGVVAYVSGRADLLFFFFGFSYMLLFFRFTEARTKWTRYNLLAGSSVCFLLSLLSKEAALIFPFLLFLAGMTILKDRSWKTLRWHLPGFIIAGMYAIIHSSFFHERYTSIIHYDGLSGLLEGASVMAWNFLSMIILPVGLHIRRVQSVDPVYGMISVISIIAILIILIIWKKSRNVAFFSSGFFLLALIPFVFVRKSFNVIAEHWVYLPSFGIFLLISLIVEWGFNQKLRIIRYSVYGISFACIAFYAGNTFMHNENWRSDIVLSDRVLSYSAHDDAAMYYKAVALIGTHDVSRALNIMDDYVEERSDDPVSWYLKGRLALSAGKTDEAKNDFLEAIVVDPSYFDGYLGLALVSFVKGEYDDGILFLQKVLKLRPKHPEALYLLGNAYLSGGEISNALETAKKAVEVNPYGYDALLLAGNAYVKAGGFQEGAKYFLKASYLYPEKPEAPYNLANVFFISEQLTEAYKWGTKAVLINSSYEPAQDLLRKIARVR